MRKHEASTSPYLPLAARTALTPLSPFAVATNNLRQGAIMGWAGGWEECETAGCIPPRRAVRPPSAVVIDAARSELVPSRIYEEDSVDPKYALPSLLLGSREQTPLANSSVNAWKRGGIAQILKNQSARGGGGASAFRLAADLAAIKAKNPEVPVLTWRGAGILNAARSRATV